MLNCCFQMNPEVGVSAFPDGDTLYRWIGTIEGPANTVYDGLKYKLTFLFPTDYPFKPPNVSHPVRRLSGIGAVFLPSGSLSNYVSLVGYLQNTLFSPQRQ